MSSPEVDQFADPKERAKAVIRSVVRGRDFQQDHRAISSAVSEDILDDAVDAAYRTQFDDDRAQFRQRIAALGELVIQQLRSKD